MIFGSSLGDELIGIQQIFFPRQWIFDVNPILLILCNLLNNKLCYGLGFDGGPLQWAEIGWLIISPGVLYGLIFLLVGNVWTKIKSFQK